MGTLTEKQAILQEIVEDIKKSSAIYLIEYKGITVDKDNAFRKNLTTKNIKYKVVKNTILKKAFDECEITGLDEYLKNSTSIMFGDTESPMLPAKELVAFHKENKDLLEVKAINMDGEILGGDKLEDVSKMPGREELIGQIVQIILGPGSNLVNVLKGPASTIAGQIKALEEKLEK